jgi:acyl-CoA thioesterase-1
MNNNKHIDISRAQLPLNRKQRMKKDTYRAYILLLISCLCFLPLTTAHANGEHRILVVGDSISAAYGIDVTAGWVHLLQERLHSTPYAHYEVINASVSGNTSADGLSRLPQLLSLYSPETVVIELGGNDGLRGYPTKLMAKNLQKMIDLSQQANAKVVLAGIEIPPNYGERYTLAFRKTFQQLAQNNTVSYIPFILENIATQPQLMQKDSIHPTAEAQPVLLENMWGAISGLLEEKRD